MSKWKKEPWRLTVTALSIAFILFMWVKKDIAAVYGTLPAEQLVPMIVTTAAVLLVKVAALAGVILLVKWAQAKFQK